MSKKVPWWNHIEIRLIKDVYQTGCQTLQAKKTVAVELRDKIIEKMIQGIDLKGQMKWYKIKQKAKRKIQKQGRKE